MNRRTIEIALPSFSWKQFFNRSTLVILSGVLMSVGFLYWFKNVYPYFTVEKAVLVAPPLEIYSEMEGVLTEMKFQEGDFFSKGDLLCKIQTSIPADLVEEKMLKIRFEMENEKKNVDEWVDRFSSNQTEIQSDFISQMMQEIQKGQEKIAALEKELENIEKQKRAPKDIEIKSACDGVLLKRFKNKNENVERLSPLFSIANGTERYLEAEIPEAILSKVSIGTDCLIAFPSSPRNQHVGKVIWMSHIVSNGKVKIKISSENLPYSQGLSATAHLKIH